MVRQRNTSIHIGIDYPSAIESKKAILQTEAAMLEIMKRIRNYNSLRKREFSLKNFVRKSMISLKQSLIDIQEVLPREEHKTKSSEKMQREKSLKETANSLFKEKRKEKDIEQALQEIKEKLSRLN